MQALGLARTHGVEPERRKAHAMTTLRGANSGGVVIVHGGQNQGSFHLADMHYYHVHRREWTPVQYSGNLHPVGRTLHTLTPISPRLLLLFGGSTATAPGQVQDLNDLWIFDFRNRAWSQIPAAGEAPSQRAGHTAVFGVGADSVPGLFVFGGTGAKDGAAVYRLSVLDWTWTRLQHLRDSDSPFPAARESHSAVWVDALQAMVISGGVPLSGSTKHLNDIWMFENVGRGKWQWTQVELDGFEGRIGHSTLLLPSAEPRIAMWGGITQRSGEEVFANEFTIVDLETKKLSVHPVRNADGQKLHGRMLQGCARVDKTFLIYGGIAPSEIIPPGVMQIQFGKKVLYNLKNEGCHSPVAVGEEIIELTEEEQPVVKGHVLNNEDGAVVATLIDNKLFMGVLTSENNRADIQMTESRPTASGEKQKEKAVAAPPKKVVEPVRPVVPAPCSVSASLIAPVQPAKSGITIENVPAVTLIAPIVPEKREVTPTKVPAPVPAAAALIAPVRPEKPGVMPTREPAQIPTAATPIAPIQPKTRTPAHIGAQSNAAVPRAGPAPAPVPAAARVGNPSDAARKYAIASASMMPRAPAHAGLTGADNRNAALQSAIRKNPVVARGRGTAYVRQRGSHVPFSRAPRTHVPGNIPHGRMNVSDDQRHSAILQSASAADEQFARRRLAEAQARQQAAQRDAAQKAALAARRGMGTAQQPFAHVPGRIQPGGSQAAGSQSGVSQVAMSQAAISQAAMRQAAMNQATMRQVAVGQAAMSQAAMRQAPMRQATMSPAAVGPAAMRQAVGMQGAGTQVLGRQAMGSQVAGRQAMEAQIAGRQHVGNQVPGRQAMGTQGAGFQSGRNQTAQVHPAVKAFIDAIPKKPKSGAAVNPAMFPADLTRRVAMAKKQTVMRYRTDPVNAHKQLLESIAQGQAARPVGLQDPRRAGTNLAQSGLGSIPVQSGDQAQQQKRQRTEQTMNVAQQRAGPVSSAPGDARNGSMGTRPAINERAMGTGGNVAQAQNRSVALQNVVAPPVAPAAARAAHAQARANPVQARSNSQLLNDLSSDSSANSAQPVQTGQPNAAWPAGGGLIARPVQSGNVTPQDSKPAGAASALTGGGTPTQVPVANPVQLLGQIAAAAHLSTASKPLQSQTGAATATAPAGAAAAAAARTGNVVDVDAMNIDVIEVVETRPKPTPEQARYNAAVDALPDSPDGAGENVVIELD